jgi:hypothetical protein
VNFTAKIDLSRVSKNTKWKAIAERFEAETAKKDYQLRVSEWQNPNEIQIEGFGQSYEHSLSFDEETSKKLMSRSETQIVRTLKKILNIFIEQDKRSKICDDFMSKLEKNDTYKTLFKSSEDKRCGNIFERIHWAMLEKVEADHAQIIEKAQKQDKILQNLEINY